jgi:hypothetical protein
MGWRRGVRREEEAPPQATPAGGTRWWRRRHPARSGSDQLQVAKACTDLIAYILVANCKKQKRLDWGWGWAPKQVCLSQDARPSGCPTSGRLRSKPPSTTPDFLGVLPAHTHAHTSGPRLTR